MRLAIMLALLLLVGCTEPRVSGRELSGRYVYVAHDAGTPHSPETLILSPAEACITKPEDNAIPACGPWQIIRGYDDAVVISHRGFTIDRRRGHIVLVEDHDLDWMYEKVD